jgi:hypothetical protein
MVVHKTPYEHRGGVRGIGKTRRTLNTGRKDDLLTAAPHPPGVPELLPVCWTDPPAMLRPRTTHTQRHLHTTLHRPHHNNAAQTAARLVTWSGGHVETMTGARTSPQWSVLTGTACHLQTSTKHNQWPYPRRMMRVKPWPCTCRAAAACCCCLMGASVPVHISATARRENPNEPRTLLQSQAGLRTCPLQVGHIGPTPYYHVLTKVQRLNS